jgi:hypothetical protein
MRDAIDTPEAMPPVRCVPQVEAGQMRQRHDRLGCPVEMLDGGQQNRLRL